MPVAEPVRTLIERLPRAVGGIGAQASQSGAAFVIQVLAARALGADGFATFALLYGAMIMATALSTGLVGDSLTVLDRHEPSLRAGLRTVAVSITAFASTVALVGALLVDSFGTGTACVYALATASFMGADLARRLLMAALRFWRLAVVDLVGLVAALAVLTGARVLTGELTLVALLGAVAVGQLVVVGVTMALLPAEERAPIARRRGDFAAVLRFGGWRAAQQFVRPTMLNVARWIVLIAAGRAVVGEIEAARVYVAPAMMLVQGVGSYLLASYAAEKAHPTRRLLRRADRSALALLATSILLGAVAVGLTPLFGPVMTAGAYELSRLAVMGWAIYAASCAAVLPYGTLAAVRGRPAGVFGLRLGDSLLSIALVVTAVMLVGTSPYWMPTLLAVGSFVGGLLCRNLLVRPLVCPERATRSPKPHVESQHSRHTEDVGMHGEPG